MNTGLPTVPRPAAGEQRHGQSYSLLWRANGSRTTILPPPLSETSLPLHSVGVHQRLLAKWPRQLPGDTQTRSSLNHFARPRHYSEGHSQYSEELTAYCRTCHTRCATRDMQPLIVKVVRIQL